MTEGKEEREESVFGLTMVLDLREGVDEDDRERK